jgi:hypothetical protein
MNTADLVPSLIRTYVPVGVGAAIAWLALKNVQVDPATQIQITALLTAALSALYYTGVRLVESRWPALGTIFLGLGVKKKPGYAKPGYRPAAIPPGGPK